MKLVTEFSNFTLNKGLAAKTALSTAGKSPEEIETSLGETFKLEGDKLKFFVNALNVAGENNVPTLKRVFVATLAEGENVPAKASKVEEHYFIPEFIAPPKAAAPADAKGGKGGKRGGPGGPRGAGDKKGGSPWGMSPEEIAAKKGKAPKA